MVNSPITRWGHHYPRRDPSRTYTWTPPADKPVGSALTVSEKRPNLSVVGVASDPAPRGMLGEEGAGAPSHRDADEDEDYDAEAIRLGLVKMDEGIWSEPETGALVDRDGIDDMLDAEEDEAEFHALTESENVGRMTSAEEAAWERTMQVAIAAAGTTGGTKH